MHYLLLMHETDINHENLMRKFRSTRLKVNKEYMRKHGLCECINYLFPVIRELRIYEIDVWDCYAESLEHELEEMGICPFSHKPLVFRVLSRLLSFLYPEHKRALLPVLINPPKKNRRINHRTKVIAKQKDPEQFDNYILCKRCNKKFLKEWL